MLITLIVFKGKCQMKKRIVVALGGNAIKQSCEEGTAEEQMRNIRNSCHHILRLAGAGHEIVLTHGNGPQVGNLLIPVSYTHLRAHET